MNILVGHSGFVGSNIASQFCFEGLFNSKNIKEAFNTHPDLLVYSGLRAEKFLANKNPQKDYNDAITAIKNIEKINPRKVVLISTIDVYHHHVDVDENTKIDEGQLQPYGLHRLFVERWVEENISDHLIVRLPALFGKNLKKNFIFDMINIIPTYLTNQKYGELVKQKPEISSYYSRHDEELYICNQVTGVERENLKDMFITLNFNALNLTDSRAEYQFYNLAYIWDHINTTLSNGIRKINLAVEPVSAGELYEYIYQKIFKNEIAVTPALYRFRTQFADLLGGKDGFIFRKPLVLRDIKEFVRKNSS